MTIIEVVRELADHPTKVFLMPNTTNLELTVDDEGTLVDLDMKPFPFEIGDILEDGWEEVNRQP